MAQAQPTPELHRIASAIDALLPQTQCAQCGYAACEPYAHAIASGEAEINRCPPGGKTLIAELAALLEREPVPPDTSCGSQRERRIATIDERGIASIYERRIALIDEDRCIGCTLCIQACPVDAILGAAKYMHTVLTALCTGCELCVAPCPVDCIAMVAPAQEDVWTRERGRDARARFDARTARLARIEEERQLGLDTRSDDAAQARQALVQAAVARARARREGQKT